MTKIINLYGAPGSGKSTGAVYIFSKLKLKNINCELVTEYAKDKVYEGSTEVFKNQVYIFGKQYFRIFKLLDKVDYIITDSPLSLSLMYNQQEFIEDELGALVSKIYNSMNNMNYLVKRVKPYNSSGRFQDEVESDVLAKGFEDWLKYHWIDFQKVNGDESGYKTIINEIQNV